MTPQPLNRIRLDAGTVTVSSPLSAKTVIIDGAGFVGTTVSNPPDVPTVIQSVGQIIADFLPIYARRFPQTNILSKALASPPQFGSVDELSKALAVYEPSNGTELIQAVYRRWEELRTTTSVPPPSEAETIPTMSLRHSSPSTLRYCLVALVSAATGAAIALIGIAGWFLITRSQAQTNTLAVVSPPTPVARPIVLAISTAGPQMRPVLIAGNTAGRESDAETTRNHGHPQRLVLSSARLSAAPTQPVAPAPHRPFIGSETASTAENPIDRPAAPLPAMPGTSASTEHFVGDAISVSGNLDSVTRQSEEVVTVDAMAASPASPAGPGSMSEGHVWPRPLVPANTYSNGDTDVTPPIPLLPRLLASLHPSSPGVRFDSLTIAVVVNPDGTAYSVTGMTVPRTMSEVVLLTTALSVVKSWQFSPALRQGVPVRYRLIVPLGAVTGTTP